MSLKRRKQMSSGRSIGTQTVLDMLDGLLAKWVLAGKVFKVVLFTNNYDPIATSTYADFTIASGTGLSPQNVDPANFGAASLSGTVGSTLCSVINTFTNGSTTITVYGYMVYDPTGNVYMFGESFASPVSMVNGYSIGVQAKLKERSAHF